MAKRHIQRRLVAILAADIAGYTRLMEEDTDGVARELEPLDNYFTAVLVLVGPWVVVMSMRLSDWLDGRVLWL